MKLSTEQRQEIHKQYLAWVEQVSDDLEDKTYFSVDEIVNKVIDIVENIQNDATRD